MPNRISYIVLYSIILSILACDNSQSSNTSKTDSTKVLLGTIDRGLLLQTDHQKWFKPTYETYEPDTNVLQQLNPLIDTLSIKVFMGTWCSDSQREVPALLHLLDALLFDSVQLHIVGVDESKTLPKESLKGYQIEYVPTIILYNKSKELGRIIEAPKTTLEKDFLDILTEYL